MKDEDGAALEGVSVDMLDSEDLEAAHDAIWVLAEKIEAQDKWEAAVLRVVAKDLVTRARKVVAAERCLH